MKNLIKIALLVGLLLPSFVLANFDRNLAYGLRNDRDVSELQEFLTSEGLYSGPVSGNFYSLTLRAVKAFQVREGIAPASGYFGPLTRAKANNLLDIDTIEVTDVTPLPDPTQSQISTLQTQILLLTNQIDEMKKTPTPTPAPAPAPAPVPLAEPILGVATPVRTLDAVVTVFDPLNLDVKKVYAGETLQLKLAAASFAPTYRIDGVKQRYFKMSLKQDGVLVSSLNANCTERVAESIEDCTYGAIGLQFQTAGEHTATIEVDGIIKTYNFTVE